MFYLIWEMGILLLLAVGFGVFVGYQLWSGDARSAEADAAIAENARLRQENENLARRLGAAESVPRMASTPAVPEAVAEPVAKAAKPAAESKPETAPQPVEPAAAKPAAKTPTKAKTPAKPKVEPKSKPKADAKPKAVTRPKAAAKPKAAAQKASAPASDDLSAIKGLGPKAAAALKAGGVTSIAQIAAWSEADIERWDAAINGRGRIVRDDWVGQAKTLAG